MPTFIKSKKGIFPKRKFNKKNKLDFIKKINKTQNKVNLTDNKFKTNTLNNKNTFSLIQSIKCNYGINSFIGMTIIVFLAFIAVILLGIYPSEGKFLKLVATLKVKTKYSLIINQTYSGLVVSKYDVKISDHYILFNNIDYQKV